MSEEECSYSSQKTICPQCRLEQDLPENWQNLPSGSTILCSNCGSVISIPEVASKAPEREDVADSEKRVPFVAKHKTPAAEGKNRTKSISMEFDNSRSTESDPIATSFLDESKKIGGTSGFSKMGNEVTRREVPKEMELRPFPEDSKKTKIFSFGSIIAIVLGISFVVGGIVFWENESTKSIREHMDVAQIWFLASACGVLGGVCLFKGFQRIPVLKYLLGLGAIGISLFYPSPYHLNLVSKVRTYASDEIAEKAPEKKKQLEALKIQDITVVDETSFEGMLKHDKYLIDQARKDTPAEKILTIRVNNCPIEHQFQVSRFFERVLVLKHAPFVMARSNTSLLVIISGCDTKLSDLARLFYQLGTIEHMDEPYRWISLQVSPRAITPIPPEALTPSSDFRYYNAQLSELSALDTQRIQQAAQRLASAQPTVLKSDITTKLGRILISPLPPNPDFVEVLMNAYKNWTAPGDPMSNEVLAQACEQFLKQNWPISPQMANTALSRYHARLNPAMTKLWMNDPQAWENAIGDQGEKAAGIYLPVILGKQVAAVEAKRSALRLLSKTTFVSQPEVVEALKQMTKDSDSQVSQLAQKLLQPK